MASTVPYRNGNGDIKYQPRLDNGERIWRGYARTHHTDLLDSGAVLYRSEKRALRVARREERRRSRRTFREIKG